MILINYLLIINLIGFIAMYIDKKKAINHQWRISEQTLISISIIGGGVGIFCGMNLFRHKTKHLKFSLGVPIIILIQILLSIIIKF